MEYRDYYKILGLERTASADQVKTAYRRLARKYHPDVSKEKNAEERFKEVQEAYEVLKDPEKRAAYDQLGSEWQSGQQFRPPPDWGSGYEFSGGAERGGAAAAQPIAPAAARASTRRRISVISSPRSSAGETPFAGGRGARAARDHHARVDISLEEAFRGATRTLELRRPEVKPDGTVTLGTHTVRVTIPAGITEGQLVRLAGQGAPAAGGGTAGDLYLEVHILPHALYQLDGRDVTLTFPVAPWEAALGAAVNVPTLGGAVAMQVPAELAVRAETAPARPGTAWHAAGRSVRAAEGRGAERRARRRRGRSTNRCATSSTSIRARILRGEAMVRVTTQVLEAHVISEGDWIAVTEICQLCRIDPDAVRELGDLGVVLARETQAGWQVPAAALPRLRIVGRLMRDLGVNVSGAALAVELIEAQRALERRLRQLESLGAGH